MKEKQTRAPIPLESRNGLTNQRGTIAMARTADPNSATAQFFINVKDNDFLNQAQSRDGNGYAVFGKVVQGMDVVDKIRGDAHRPRRRPLAAGRDQESNRGEMSDADKSIWKPAPAPSGSSSTMRRPPRRSRTS